MELVFRRKWEAAHRFIENGETLCAQPHGHTWHAEVTVSLPQNYKINLSSNVHTPFWVLKSKWHEWIDNHVDHSFKFNSKDPLLAFMINENPKGRHLVVQGDPTTEMIALCFKAKYQAFLNELNLGVMCSKITIEETPTNAVTFSGDPLLHLPPQKQYWWNRSDMTINDLNN